MVSKPAFASENLVDGSPGPARCSSAAGVGRSTLYGVIDGALSRSVVALLRLPARSLRIPGWFPLVADRVHPHLAGIRDVEQVRYGNVVMELDLRDVVQRRIFYHAHEPPELAFVRTFVRAGDIVLDVGAHVGLFTLAAGRLVGSTGEVHAFEPVPTNFARLERNVRLNELENVRLNRAAAGSSAGTLALGLDQPARGQDDSSAMFSRVGRASQVAAPELRLDSYVAEHLAARRLRLVKLDVEGMEADALEGLSGLLAADAIDAFLIEINLPLLRRNGKSSRDVSAPLQRHGFRLYRVGSWGLRRLAGLPEAGVRPTPRSRSVLRLGLETRDWLFDVVALSPRAVRERTNRRRLL